jgi:glycosyltransferase involved in cell wall biosynthesis
VRIVLVVPGGVDRGGRERVIPALLWLIERLAADNEVLVVALGQEPVASRYELLGATIVNVPPEARGPHRLARMIARAVRAVGSAGPPDIVHGLWASVSGLSAVLAARRYRVPSLVHVAGGELLALRELDYGGALGRGGRLITSTTLRLAGEVTVASDWMAAHVRANGWRVDRVIPLGVDLTRFTPLPPATAGPTTGGADRLVHVASLNRVKDQTTLLRAVALVHQSRPALRVDIAGVDTLDGAVERLAAELLPAGVVHFHGFVPSDELAPLYRAAALNIITSRHEAGPVAVLEAAACGTATVGTTVGHVADLASRREPAAIAVPVGDHRALAEAIVSLLADDSRRDMLARRARRWACEHDADATAEAFLSRYRAARARRR